LVNIDRTTIHKWIRLRKIDPRPLRRQGKRRVRCWDKARLDELRKRANNYRSIEAHMSNARAMVKAVNEKRRQARLDKLK
jgi:hypothetical protein